MEENLFDDLSPVNVRQSVEQYEEMLRSRSIRFFDIADFDNIIFYYEQRDEWKKALQVLDYAIEQHAYSTEFITKKASILIYYHKYREAHILLDQAEAMQPGDMMIQIIRSDLFVLKREFEKSIAILKSALLNCTKEDREELLFELAEVYEDTEQYDELFDCFYRILEANPQSQEALNRMWYCLELSGKTEESILLHEKILDEFPYSYLAWNNLGHAYLAKKNYEKAIDAFELVTAINENCDMAYRDCGEAWFHLKKYHKAIEQFHKAIEFSRAYEELLFSIGVCYEKLKDFAAARSYYRKTLLADPQYAEACYRIGETYNRQRLWNQAIHYYRKAQRLTPDNVYYLMAMARACCKLKQSEMIMQCVESVMALNINYKTRSHYEKLIRYLIQAECFEEALNLMDYSTLEKGTLPVFAFLRSICYWKTGRTRQAANWLEQGLTWYYSKHPVLFKFAPELRDHPQVMMLLESYKTT